MHKIVLHLKIAAALLSLPAASRAQNFVIDWFSINGGGGTSTGALYAVSGTIGQPAAGTLGGANYLLVSGFWAVALQTPGAPWLSIERHPVSGAAIVSWDARAPGFVLEQTTTLAGPIVGWGPVQEPYQTNAGRIFITEPVPAGHRFFRLRRQP